MKKDFKIKGGTVTDFIRIFLSKIFYLQDVMDTVYIFYYSKNLFN